MGVSGQVLRHPFATALFVAGEHPKVVQALLLLRGAGPDGEQIELLQADVL